MPVDRVPPPGIIPARAGFTTRRMRRRYRDSDHPRSRGVYGRSPASLSRPTGSSPLARGLLPTGLTQNIEERIIPARAGFTRTAASNQRPCSDHPRSRGVYSRKLAAPQVGNGSSPLARGLRSAQDGAGYGPGIIPARAGFTCRTRRTPTTRRDHPRSRGVYMLKSMLDALFSGSSPLARGLPDGVVVQGGPEGIIPARAGFTAHRRSSVHDHPDHPRSRGVYEDTDEHSPRELGSSPLARGLRVGVMVTYTVHRIIPARAGFTRRIARSASRRSDHPRSRGVYLGPSHLPSLSHGSSPLARGLRAAL